LVPTNAGSVAVFAHTPHPHAALLFIDFLIGPDGQKIFGEKFGYGNPGKEYGFKKWYPEQGLTTYEYAETIEKWNKLLVQISRK
jgi:ABC-type Fe3+ transport system substrate-binding protein